MSDRNIQTPPASRESSPSPSLKRKVHFRVCEFKYYEPGTEQELALYDKENLYYNDRDFGNIESESNETLRRMMRSSSSPAQLEKNLVCRRNLSSRGLEERTPRGARQQIKNQTKAVRLVLTIQRLQREKNENNPEGLSRRYRKLVAPCVSAAYGRGLQDQIFAEWIAEGCPEAPLPAPEKNATEERCGNEGLYFKDSNPGMHLIHHRRTESPQFNFCGNGLSRFFKHNQLFVSIN